MTHSWGQAEDVRIPVKFTERHPYGENKSTLVHFLGTVARNWNYAPLNYKSWRKVPEFYKENIVQLVKRKFDVPDAKDGWVKQSVGKKWKNWKTKIKSLYFNPSLSIEAQLHNVPPCVKDEQWEGVLQIFHSEEMKVLSQKNKASRAKQKMIPRAGKKSFAEIAMKMKEEYGRSPTRMELFANVYIHKKKDGTESASEAAKEALEKMRKLAEEAPEDFDDSLSRNDIFSQVMGQEKNGYVRMCRLGVCPSDVFGPIPSSLTSYMRAMEMKAQVDYLKEKHEAMSKEVQELREFVHNNERYMNATFSSRNLDGSSEQPRGNTRTSSRQSIRARSTVTLRSIMDRAEVVAKGIVSNMDPSSKVGGVELGSNWCEVQVQVPVKWDEPLIQPYDIFQIIGDAIGAPVAWPLSLVVLDDEFQE